MVWCHPEAHGVFPGSWAAEKQSEKETKLQGQGTENIPCSTGWSCEDIQTQGALDFSGSAPCLAQL